eukprot:IDg6097t1
MSRVARGCLDTIPGFQFWANLCVPSGQQISHRHDWSSMSPRLTGGFRVSNSRLSALRWCIIGRDYVFDENFSFGSCSEITTNAMTKNSESKTKRADGPDCVRKTANKFAAETGFAKVSSSDGAPKVFDPADNKCITVCIDVLLEVRRVTCVLEADLRVIRSRVSKVLSEYFLARDANYENRFSSFKLLVIRHASKRAPIDAFCPFLTPPGSFRVNYGAIFAVDFMGGAISAFCTYQLLRVLLFEIDLWVILALLEPLTQC